MSSIFIIAHDGGCEGHSLPMLAFHSKEEALAWKKSHTDTWSVAEVPIYPAMPLDQWFALKEINE